MSICRVIIICLLASGAASLRAANYYAARNGQPPGGDCSTWEKASSNIQDAVNAATTNDTVWVGAGRYTVPPNATNYAGTNVVFINRPLTLRSSNGVPETTIIDGEGTNRGIAVSYPYNSNNRFVFDGLTISNCQAITIGGGIFLDCPIYSGNAWTGVVQNCRILNNTVVYGPGTTNPPIPASGGYVGQGAWGGAIGSHNRDGAFGLILSNCVLRGNLATNGMMGDANGGAGGAIYCASRGTCTITGCKIQNNTAYVGGNAYLSIYMTVENSEISGGRAGSGSQAFAGGFFHASGSVIYRNCLLFGNNGGVGGRGSAIYNGMQGYWGVVELFNCTVVSNLSGGAAIYIRPWSSGQNYQPSLHLVNSIVYSNSTDISLGSSGGLPASYSSYSSNSCIGSTNSASVMFGTTNLLCFLGPSSGNITNNPRFVDFAGNNFRLSRYSPCVNRGFNMNLMTNWVDFDGNMRIRYGTVDMGAYELIFSGSIYTFH